MPDGANAVRQEMKAPGIAATRSRFLIGHARDRQTTARRLPNHATPVASEVEPFGAG
jgi:hypothetical protein